MSGSLGGKRILVTGATSGIGKVAALELARLGATVQVHGRNSEKTNATVTEIQRLSGNTNVEAVLADFSSLSEVRRLADLVAQKGTLNALVNNAGVGVFEHRLTPDGFEVSFAVNHLAPFLLTNLLSGALRAGAPSRVVTVSSQSHRMGRIAFDDLNLANNFSGNRAYGQSKLANLLFTFELARRLAGSGVVANAFDPGPTKTGMMDDILTKSSGLQKVLAGILMPLVSDTPENVGSALAWVARSPSLEGVSGVYFGKRKQRITPSRRARDEELAAELWEVSRQMTDCLN